MPFLSKDRRGAGVIPLRSAVLCVDCESVISSRVDKCPVCDSRSVFSIARMLGGSMKPQIVRPERAGGAVRFDLDIDVAVKQVSGKDVDPLVDGISESIRVLLGPNRASMHVNVEPVADAFEEEKAA